MLLFSLASHLKKPAFVFAACWFFSWLAFLVPFVSVTIPPIVDLPQQVGQIKLLLSFSNYQHDHVIFWWHPNHLAYLFLGLGWMLCGPMAAGSLGMWLLAGFWLAGLFQLGWRLQRPCWMLILASTLFFNFTMYWGFYSFLTGQAIFFFAFACWLDPTKHRFAYALAFALLLYASHVLWWAFALGMLVLWCLLRWRESSRWRSVLLGYASTLPLVIAWYLHIRDLTLDDKTLAGWPWYLRLHPSFIQHFSYGALPGWIEAVFFWGIFSLFLASSFYSYQKNYAQKLAFMPLFLMSLLLGVSILFLPTFHRITIFFGERWIPVACLFFFLSWTGFDFPKSFLAHFFSFACLAFFLFKTTTTWISVEKEEYAGLMNTIQSLPKGASIVGVDLKKTTPYLKLHRPFLQSVAYAFIKKEAKLLLSFSSLYPCLVLRMDPESTIAGSPEWFPLKYLDKDNIKLFSHALVFGTATQQQFAQKHFELETVSIQGYWGLYRTKKAPHISPP